MALSGSKIDFGGQVMALEMSLFDALESKAWCARIWIVRSSSRSRNLARSRYLLKPPKSIRDPRGDQISKVQNSMHFNSAPL
jgi:hypothetical protein